MSGATWHVYTHLANDSHAFGRCKTFAKRLSWDVEQLAHALKEYVEIALEQYYDDADCGPWEWALMGDLYCSKLREVDWRALAAKFLEKA